MTFSFTINLLCDLVRLFDLCALGSYPEKWCQLTISFSGSVQGVSEVSQVDHEHLYRPVSRGCGGDRNLGRGSGCSLLCSRVSPAGRRSPSAKFGGKQGRSWKAEPPPSPRFSRTRPTES